MNIVLPPELEQLVTARVQSGRYSSVSEVIREALESDQYEIYAKYNLIVDLFRSLEEHEENERALIRKLFIDDLVNQTSLSAFIEEKPSNIFDEK